MMNSARLMMVLMSMMFLASCVDSSGKMSPVKQDNKKPVAIVDDDFSVIEQDLVTLDGSRSYDDDGIVSYSWTQLSGAPLVVISNPDSAISTFRAPIVIADQLFAFKLQVTDSLGEMSEKTIMITVRPQPVVSNQSPIATISTVSTSLGGVQVNLDGSNSRDDDGTINLYQWTQISGSPTVLINQSNTALAHFTSPSLVSDTQLGFELAVTDNLGAVSKITTLITIQATTVTNMLPTAVVPNDFSVFSNSTVVLDGSSSTDSDGTINQYQWVQTAGAPVVSIHNAASDIANFSASLVTVNTDFSFELTVTDDQGGIDKSVLTITVQPLSTSTTTITPLMTASRTQCTAPCGIMFDATGSTATGIAEPFHELEYQWDYGDPGAVFKQRSGIDANRSIAPLGAHVYEKAGTYAATVNVSSNDGSTASQTASIVVLDPANVYGAETYCVSSSADFSACPSQDSLHHFTTFAAAATFIQNLRFNQASRPTQVLFRAGDSFVASQQYTVRELTAELLIDSYGSGVAPIINVGSSMTNKPIFLFQDSHQITITHLNFSGPYDPTTGLGEHALAIWFYLGVSDALVYQNTFTGIDTAVYPHGGSSTLNGAPSQHVMLVDNAISDWQDYAVFGTFGKLSTMLANSIKQNPNAVSGSEGKCGSCLVNYPDHGPIRAGYSNQLLIQYNDMFNNAGWSSAGLAHQPNIRLGTAGTSLQSVIADNLLEGGFTIVSMTPANPGTANAATHADVIIERNQMTASDNTWQMIDMGLGGAVIRNNLFLKPDNGAPSIGSGSFQSAIVFKVDSARTTAGNLLHSNRIYNNTLISNAQTSAPNASFLRVDNSFSVFEIHNNLVYLPFVANNGDAGLISWNYSAPLTQVVSDHNIVYSPNNPNYVWNNNQSEQLSTWQLTGNDSNSVELDPLLQDPASFNASLLSNSPAINAGVVISGLTRDYQQTTRGNTIDVGAFEF